MLEEIDPEVAELVRRERARQESTINLIASENYPSSATLEAQCNILVSKAVEGYPGKRYFGGCSFVDAVENLAIDRAKKLFGAEHANVQCITGTQANYAVYLAMLEVGDTVLAMDPIHGGHLSQGNPINLSGRIFSFIHYGVDPETERINYDTLSEIAERHQPKMIIAGGSACPREIDFKAFRKVAEDVNAYFLVDMAHIAGLIVAGIHQDPIPHADFITSSTHKTLRGPRGGGLILCRKKYAEKIDRAVFPGLQSAPLMYVIAGRAVLFKEAMSLSFRKYQKRTVENAKTLAEELMKRGFKLVTDGTDTHLMLLDLTNKGMSGRKAQSILDSVGIVANKNTIPFDKRRPYYASGIRIGTPALTTRGMKEDEMREIAEMIDLILNDPDDGDIKHKVGSQVKNLTDKFPLFSKEWQN